MVRFSAFLTIGLFLFSFALTGCTRDPSESIPAPVKPDTEHPQTKPTYILHPGDLLLIDMYLEPDNRSEVRVSQDGTINLNLIKQVQVRGLTVHQAKELITEKYREYFKDPQITIIIKEYAPRLVYVHGFVNRSGPVYFPFEGDLTLSRAIALAGGLQPRASRTTITIRRVVDGKQTTMVRNLADIDSGKAADVYLLEDDAIYVEDSVI